METTNFRKRPTDARCDLYPVATDDQDQEP